MTWVEDATINEDKQCLQRDVTEVDVSRRGAGRTCLMFAVWLAHERAISQLKFSKSHEFLVPLAPQCSQFEN